MRINRSKINGMLLFFSIFPACEFDKKIDIKNSDATFAEDGLLVNKTLRLMTPEQFVKIISSALKYDDQSVLQALIDRYGVALGGVDFRVAMHRNQIPSGQSQLSIRRLAWDISTEIIKRDVDLQSLGKPGLSLNKVVIAVDRPTVSQDFLLPPEALLAIKEGEERFTQQINDLYWLLLARPPSSAELEHLKSTFVQVVAEEGSAESAWRVLLYAVLASMEFWNI